MRLLTHIARMLASALHPATHAYSTIVYPVQGKAVVMHDGLGIRRERPWYQLSESLLRQDDTRTHFDSMQHDSSTWDDPSMHVHADDLASGFMAANGSEVMDTTGVNPANGLPMMDGGIDVMGNPFGTDMLSDSWSFDCGLGGCGSSFSDFDFG